MAAGDAVVSLSPSVAAGAFVTIQPGAGVEWLIQNIMSQGSIVLEWFDGTNAIDFETSPVGQPGAYLNTTFRLTNALFLRVKNNEATTKNIGYTGVQTK
jgi:hypothetical protein